MSSIAEYCIRGMLTAVELTTLLSIACAPQKNPPSSDNPNTTIPVKSKLNGTALEQVDFSRFGGQGLTFGQSIRQGNIEFSNQSKGDQFVIVDSQVEVLAKRCAVIEGEDQPVFRIIFKDKLENDFNMPQLPPAIINFDKSDEIDVNIGALGIGPSVTIESKAYQFSPKGREKGIRNLVNLLINETVTRATCYASIVNKLNRRDNPTLGEVALADQVSRSKAEQFRRELDANPALTFMYALFP